ncbi:hypothetical protein Tco_1245896 [Tanacetum coccineum]
MYEMNNSLNLNHREVFEDVVNRHEMEIVMQEKFLMLEEELESYKSSKFIELEKANAKAASWKKIARVLMFVLSVMLFMFLVLCLIGNDDMPRMAYHSIVSNDVSGFNGNGSTWLLNWVNGPYYAFIAFGLVDKYPG